jgi:restriction system protein
MAYTDYPSRRFRYSLESYDRGLKMLQYPGALKPPAQSWSLDSPVPQGAIEPRSTKSLLYDDALGPPHGFDLLRALPIPEFPSFPLRPDTPEESINTSYLGMGKKVGELKRETQRLREEFEKRYREDAAYLEQVLRACKSSDPAAISRLMEISHIRHPLPESLRLEFKTDLDLEARLVLCTIEIPDFSSLRVLKPRGDKWMDEWKAVSATDKKRAIEAIFYSLPLRAAYLVAKSDEGNWFDVVVVNAEQRWFDPATGKKRRGIVASLQATRDVLRDLELQNVNPKTCFRHLKGIATPSLEQTSPVRPIFILNRADNRLIENKDVSEELEPEANLAAMPWEEFEHLVRQLFEWEFGRNGIEVRVTRASRDRGVDAIMFDPDPLRGGKYVLQAKRYTRPVDVAAVRDLYGTVVNEGANRGILVTTSSYGPDSYEFAKDKPISLVDGPNLIAMLKRHGRDYRIDLVEARRLLGLDDSARS